jgi:hypothetical protein
MEAVPIAILIALIAVSVIEGLLWLTWTRLYFTTGIPVFSRELNALSPGARVPTAKEISERLAHSKYAPLVFHDLGGNRIALREKAFTSYTPVMRGLLVFDPRQAKVRVTGLANWFPLRAVAGVCSSHVSMGKFSGLNSTRLRALYAQGVAWSWVFLRDRGESFS